MFTRHLNSFFSKLFKYIRGERVPAGITVTFSAPRLLQVEREAEHYQQIQTVIQILSELGINKEWLKRKYLNLPFEEIERFENSEILKKKITGPKPGDESEAGGLGAGAYGGSSFGGGGMGGSTY
jgi:hypothetical protein